MSSASLAPTESIAPVSLTSIAVEIMAIHTATFATCRSSLDAAKRMGDLLILAQDQVEHGQWLPWLAANVNLSKRTTQGYMQIARSWPALEAERNARPDALLDITEALRFLAKPKPHEENGDEADDDEADHDDDGDGDGDDHHDDDGGNGDDTDTSRYPKTLILRGTVASTAQFREDIHALAARHDITADNLSDLIFAVVHAAAHESIDDDLTTETETGYELHL